jgi:hypothetical protein
LTRTVGPSDNWSAVCLVIVTNSPSPKPKVDKLFAHLKMNICTPKSRTICHNVTVRPTATFAHMNYDTWSNVFSEKSMENSTVSKKISNFSNFLPSQVINPLRPCCFSKICWKQWLSWAARDLVTIGPNFTSHNGWTNCHRRLDQLSQVTMSPPSPRGGRKICGLNDTGTKKMWVEKFKSPHVTRTNRVGWIVTRTKRGWTKHQGTLQGPIAKWESLKILWSPASPMSPPRLIHPYYFQANLIRWEGPFKKQGEWAPQPWQGDKKSPTTDPQKINTQSHGVLDMKAWLKPNHSIIFIKKERANLFTHQTFLHVFKILKSPLQPEI